MKAPNKAKGPTQSSGPFCILRPENVLDWLSHSGWTRLRFAKRVKAEYSYRKFKQQYNDEPALNIGVAYQGQFL
jgi:hypothetical protein